MNKQELIIELIRLHDKDIDILDSLAQMRSLCEEERSDEDQDKIIQITSNGDDYGFYALFSSGKVFKYSSMGSFCECDTKIR